MSDDTKGGSCRVYRGIDSAWGGKAPGARARLDLAEDERALELREVPVRERWDGMVAAAGSFGASGNEVVNVDQPLVVTLATASMRPVERGITRALVKSHGCAAYPANLTNDVCFGPAAGIWRFLRVLEARGFRYDPAGAQVGAEGLLVFEGYPHPSLIGMFDLPRLLRYKAGRGDGEAWDKLLALLEGLAVHPELPLVDRCGFFDSVRAHTKTNEDLVDAVVCAYAGAWIHRLPAVRSAVLGDAATGAIVTPVSPGLRAALAARMPAELLDVIAPGAITIPYPEAGSPAVLEAAAYRTARAAGAVPPPVDAVYEHGEPDDEGFREVQLLASDPGCLWQRANGVVINPWLDQFEDVDLEVRLLDDDGEPSLFFVPFGAQGNVQRGMKPLDDGANKELWHVIAEGCTRADPQAYRVRYRYTER